MVDGNRVLRGSFAVQTRHDPRDKKPDWPGPGGTEVPLQPTDKDGYTNGRRTKFPENLCPKKGEKIDRKDETRDNDCLGPGAYQIKMTG